MVGVPGSRHPVPDSDDPSPPCSSGPISLPDLLSWEQLQETVRAAVCCAAPNLSYPPG